MNTVERWRVFLPGYISLVREVTQIELWPPDPEALDWNAWNRPPADESDIRRAEERLNLELPPSLRSFYQTSNGLPGIGLMLPEIVDVSALDWVANAAPEFHQMIREFENEPGPWPDDPDGSRLAEYRYHDCTRVARSLVLSGLENDSYMLLADPFETTIAKEWRCGRWAHWYPGMNWDDEPFATYIFLSYEEFMERKSSSSER